MANVGDDRRLILRPDVVSTVLQEGAVILDLRSKFFFSANASGWSIVQMFESGATRTEVLEACRRWGAGGVDEPAIEALIALLTAEQLVEPTESPSAPLGEMALAAWSVPTLVKHKEPLQRIMVSAFDPGIPMAE